VWCSSVNLVVDSNKLNETVQTLWKEYKREDFDPKSIEIELDDNIKMILEEFMIDYKKNPAPLFDFYSTDFISQFYKGCGLLPDSFKTTNVTSLDVVNFNFFNPPVLLRTSDKTRDEYMRGQNTFIPEAIFFQGVPSTQFNSHFTGGTSSFPMASAQPLIMPIQMNQPSNPLFNTPSNPRLLSTPITKDSSVSTNTNTPITTTTTPTPTTTTPSTLPISQSSSNLLYSVNGVQQSVSIPNNNIPTNSSIPGSQPIVVVLQSPQIPINPPPPTTVQSQQPLNINITRTDSSPSKHHSKTSPKPTKSRTTPSSKSSKKTQKKPKKDITPKEPKPETPPKNEQQTININLNISDLADKLGANNNNNNNSNSNNNNKKEEDKTPQPPPPISSDPPKEITPRGIEYQKLNAGKSQTKIGQLQQVLLQSALDSHQKQINSQLGVNSNSDDKSNESGEEEEEEENNESSE